MDEPLVSRRTLLGTGLAVAGSAFLDLSTAARSEAALGEGVGFNVVRFSSNGTRLSTSEVVVAPAWDGNYPKGTFVWKFVPGKSEHGWGSITGFKFRPAPATEHGRVALICSAHGKVASVPLNKVGQRGVISRLSDARWHMDGNVGTNPHSIELVPASGPRPDLIVVAAEGGAGAEGTLTVVEYAHKKRRWNMTFHQAHAVLWDPANSLLWAAGGRNDTTEHGGRLEAYEFHTSNNRWKLRRVGKVLIINTGFDATASLPDTCHDLQPDYAAGAPYDTMYLASNLGIHKISKNITTDGPAPTAELVTLPAASQMLVKSISRTPTGDLLWTQQQAHSYNAKAKPTDSAISLGDSTMYFPQSAPPGGIFWRTYKARSFTSRYQ